MGVGGESQKVGSASALVFVTHISEWVFHKENIELVKETKGVF